MAGAATTILVMRHAEKPDDPFEPDLTKDGHARAEKLVGFIQNKFGTPDFIFAAAITRHSARPYETVRPLSRATGIGIDATIADNDYGVLAELLRTRKKYAGKLVVVCWHHGNIPPMMRYLGAEKTDYPRPWDHKVFNLILRTEISGDEVSVKKVKEKF
jgi:hypothetical protein